MSLSLIMTPDESRRDLIALAGFQNGVSDLLAESAYHAGARQRTRSLTARRVPNSPHWACSLRLLKQATATAAGAVGCGTMRAEGPQGSHGAGENSDGATLWVLAFETTAIRATCGFAVTT